MGNAIDHSTLNWVKQEIDETLKQARHALEAYVENPADVTQLRFMYNYIHQVHGTLYMVELYGAALLTEEMEKLSQALMADEVSQKDSAYELLMRSIIQLPDYLEKIQSGLRDDPLILMPLLNDLRAARGEHLLSESVLVAPHLKTEVKVPVTRKDTGMDGQQLAKKLRHHFQLGLLGWYRNQDPTGSLKKLRMVLTQLEEGCDEEILVRIFWVASGLVEALLDGGLGASVAMNKMLGQVDREVKRLIDEGENTLAQSASPDLLTNLLYYIIRATSAGPRVLEIRQRFELNTALASSQEIDSARQSLSGPNSALLETVSVAIREYLTQVKDALDLFLRGERRNIPELNVPAELLRKIADTLGMLGLGRPRKTILEQEESLLKILAGTKIPTEDALMDIAHALLKVESTLERLAKTGGDKTKIGLSPENENENESESESEEEAPRLDLGELRDIQSTLLDEIAVNMAKVKDAIVSFIDSPWEPSVLNDVPKLFNEIQGGMKIVELHRPSALVGGVKAYVTHELLEKKRQPNQEELDTLADVIASVEYYLEAMPEQRAGSESMLETAGQALEKLGYPAVVQGTAGGSLANEGGDKTFSSHKAVSGAAAAGAGEVSTENAAPVARVERLEDISWEVSEKPKSMKAPKSVGEKSAPQAETKAPEIKTTGKTAPNKAAKALAQAEASRKLLSEVDDDILSIFIEEAREESAVIAELFPKWKRNPDNQDALSRIRRAFHTLKGSGRLVGETEIGEFAWAFENVFNRLLDHTVVPNPDLVQLIDQAVSALPKLIVSVETRAMHEVDVEELSRRAFHLVQNEKYLPEESLSPELNEVTVFAPTNPVLVSKFSEPTTETRSESTASAADVMDPVLYDIFSKESAGHLQEIHRFLDNAKASGMFQVTENLVRSLHTLHGSARMAGSAGIAELAGLLEKYSKTALGNDNPLNEEGLACLAQGMEATKVLLAQINQAATTIPNTRPLVVRIQDLYEFELHEQARRVNQIDEDSDVKVDSLESVSAAEEQAEYDLELLEVFLEEATEILDSSEAILRRLKQSPADAQIVSELQRELHTLKGGARMAGIGPIGDLAHAVESLLTDISEERLDNSPEIVDLMHQVLDRLFAMLETTHQRAKVLPVPGLVEAIDRVRAGELPQLRESSQDLEEIIITSPEYNGEVATENADDGRDAGSKSSSGDRAMQGAIAEAQTAELFDFPTAPALKKAVPKPKPLALPAVDEMRATGTGSAIGSHDSVRVRADLLDNLVNYAGEVSIYRSRLEQQNTVLGGNLDEMGHTVGRLQEQLRKLEIEAEAQILYRHEREGTARSDFDPLELDRYSQVQELSRGLSESINDISSIKTLLDNLLRESDTLLLQQARINTELQEGLMRTRMVPFSQIGTRLRRIVRQTCQELEKEADLEIIGEHGEVDRTVLERITAPIEHMLRNSLSHGIESARRRRDLGKPEKGRLSIDISRHGSEVILKVADDGAGMDFKAIRKKAIEKGLIDRQADVSDQDVMQFILESGFSTAEKITQISGRGVGMDVVNSEIKQLGGILDIESKPNEGSTFTIHFPLTLAMNHALMVNAGEELYAMALSGIEGIVRISHDDLAGYIADSKKAYEYAGNQYHVQKLSQLLGITADLGTLSKVAPLLLIRSGDYRVALQVDNLMGSREIVVKSIGAQLSTVRGISGATILGDGRVVLILDVASLVRMSATMKAQSAREVRRRTTIDEQHRPTIMVVDDSITVRKVTTRLLERNNMLTLIAKDGVDAIAILGESIPDLMLLDIEMPRMDGFELATYIRNEPRLRHIPIIMITSRTGDKHRNRAAEIGVNGYLGKPYQELDLLNRIRELLKDTYGDTAVNH